jgi:hypothetical protein
MSRYVQRVRRAFYLILYALQEKNNPEYLNNEVVVLNDFYFESISQTSTGFLHCDDAEASTDHGLGASRIPRLGKIRRFERSAAAVAVSRCAPK